MNIQKLDLLIGIYIFCIAVSELMGGKTFPLVHIGDIHLNASVAIFTMPLLFSINDIITEVHGPARTRSIIRTGLLIILLILIFSLLATWLPPSSRFASSEPAYDLIFGVSARIAAASLTAFAVAEFLDVQIFLKVKRRFEHRALWLRNNVSNIVAQLVDTTIFISLAFYMIGSPWEENIAFLTSLIIPYWLLKCCMSIVETPFVYLGVKWLKQKDYATSPEVST
jgi:hypothetical protein